MKRLRSKLTYANVVATLALFLVVAGGSALAASNLAKNSVGSKQIKTNAVTTSKIKNGAVTGAKINLSTVGSVPSAAHADTATNATHAGSADSAGTAANANALGGSPASAFAKTALEPEHLFGTPGQPALENGCTQPAVEPAGFYKDPFGVVHIRGFLTGCTNEAPAFTLPPGFRPAGISVSVTGTGNATSGLLRVDPNGVATIFGGGVSIIDSDFRTQ